MEGALRPRPDLFKILTLNMTVIRILGFVVVAGILLVPSYQRAERRRADQARNFFRDAWQTVVNLDVVAIAEKHKADSSVKAGNKELACDQARSANDHFGQAVMRYRNLPPLPRGTPTDVTDLVGKLGSELEPQMAKAWSVVESTCGT
jgi:hypothetical protein